MPKFGARSNTGEAEQAMRVAAIHFMTALHGDDVRVIHELAMGRRRIDLVFVYKADIVGVEIKGPLDGLSDGRLEHQMEAYNYFLPEVWLAVHPKWTDHRHVRCVRNVLILNGDKLERENSSTKWEPYRDEMCCSRLLELLWQGEAKAVARRHDLIQCQLLEMWPAEKVKRLLARLLTGQEIMREVCAELRSRPLTGIGSDAPLAPRSGFSTPKALADLFDPR